MAEKETKADKKPNGSLVFQTLAMPASANANGDIFGGWVLSQMDLGAGVLAKKFAKSRVTTVSLEAMSFDKPVYIGDVVSCYAELVSVGKTSMKIQIETWVTREVSGLQEAVTRGLFTFVAIDKTGKPHFADPTKRK